MESKQISVEHQYVGCLEGHGGLVTSIVSGFVRDDDKEQEILVSGSRDKKLIIWKLKNNEDDDNQEFFGEPYVSLTGHNHFISDLSLSQDCSFVLSSSWDKSLRLWSLKTGKCTAKFFGSSKEVTSCTFSNDSRQIFSTGFDNKLTLWNNQGEFKAISKVYNHGDCVSRIRHSPSAKHAYYASVGWDGKLKIWSQFFKIKVSFTAHEDPINALAINTNGIHLATGGKDCKVKIWKIQEIEQPKIVYQSDSVVNDIAFNPEFQWVAAVSDKSVKIWDISRTKKDTIVSISNKDFDDSSYKFTSIAWNSTGKYLYCGCSDGKIRVFKIFINNESNQ